MEEGEGVLVVSAWNGKGPGDRSAPGSVNEEFTTCRMEGWPLRGAGVVCIFEVQDMRQEAAESIRRTLDDMQACQHRVVLVNHATKDTRHFAYPGEENMCLVGENEVSAVVLAQGLALIFIPTGGSPWDPLLPLPPPL